MIQTYEQRQAERSRLFKQACDDAISYWTEKGDQEQVNYFNKLKSKR